MGGISRTTGRVAPAYLFEIGEDVVAELDLADVFAVDTGTCLPPGVAPAWTIATVIDRMSDDGGIFYVLRFALEHFQHFAVVLEAAIEGTA